jgi:uncharacterized protein
LVFTMNQKEIEILCNSVNLEGNNLIETHISWVILGPNYAYKIKKPVTFSFLDFSTLKRRKYFCEKEVTLNQRLAKKMYIGVAPIFKEASGIISFNASPDIADYAVVMKKMNRALEMDKLVQQSGKIQPAIILALAKKLAEFHKNAAVIPGKYNIDELRVRFNDIGDIGNTLDETYSSLIKKAIRHSDLFLAGHTELFSRRQAEGFVRDVHGDLHTGNIFLYRNPVIFDCIEFDDNMRRIDILDEVAFLCMDLESYGCTDLSDLFYNQYLAFSGLEATESNHELFRYYKLYRANIRAKIALIRLNDDFYPEKRLDNNTCAIRYLNLVHNYVG